MTPELLHQHLIRSLCAVINPEFERSLRVLLESGSAERFLTDLLFLTLHAVGYDASREFPIGKRDACDLVIHADRSIHIEAKQLHLKDGCRYAPSNLSRDLRRHNNCISYGVMYVLDERSSKVPRRYERFGNKNRTARFDIEYILKGLKDTFAVVVPSVGDSALLKHFDTEGHLDVFGFVVAAPRINEQA